VINLFNRHELFIFLAAYTWKRINTHVR
jgi:hypothetical protein